MKMIGLFSGIGGFELAAKWVWGDLLDIKCMVEIDPFPQKVLAKNFPGVPIHGDIRTFRGDEWGPIDIITGGFPCQPFSDNGKRKGKKDDRYLWPEMLRVIEEAKPSWVVGENVAGLINLGLEEVLTSLETLGYETQTFIIPACATDARHLRNRVWVVAHTPGNGWDEAKIQNRITPTDKWIPREYCSSNDKEMGGVSHSDFCRKVDGVPDWVDRLKGLGNAIVPQVAQRIFWGVRCVDEAIAT